MRNLLEEMRRNPAGDWTISDVESLCRAYAIRCTPPKRGSHYTVSHESLAEILTIPFGRPIKKFYIKGLVKFVDLLGGPDERS